jgi:hypothetical protein
VHSAGPVAALQGCKPMSTWCCISIGLARHGKSVSGSQQAVPCGIRTPRVVRGRGVALQGCSKAPAEAPRLASVPTRLKTIFSCALAPHSMLSVIMSAKPCQLLLTVKEPVRLLLWFVRLLQAQARGAARAAQAEGEDGQPQPLTHTGGDAAQEAAAAPADPRAAPSSALIYHVCRVPVATPPRSTRPALTYSTGCSVLLQTPSSPAATGAQHIVWSAACPGTLEAGPLFC